MSQLKAHAVIQLNTSELFIPISFIEDDDDDDDYESVLCLVVVTLLIY
jgi:hypothetical protein